MLRLIYYIMNHRACQYIKPLKTPKTMPISGHKISPSRQRR
ncbi:hypothetical protein HMPREF3201_02044 [Megasphaera sp. MJR8396C]|nr:hypothetical protein HMPREF3201_02044 [Megasphaera sp. MJR8396C]